MCHYISSLQQYINKKYTIFIALTVVINFIDVCIKIFKGCVKNYSDTSPKFKGIINYYSPRLTA